MLLGGHQAPHGGLEHRRELIAAAFLEDVVDGLAVFLPEPLERRLQLRLAPRADDAHDVAAQRILPGHHRVAQRRGLRPRQLVVDELAGVTVRCHQPHQELLEGVLVERAGGNVLLEGGGVGGAVGLPDGDEVVRRRRAGDLDEHPHVPVTLLLHGLVGELGVARRRVHGPQHHRALAGDTARRRRGRRGPSVRQSEPSKHRISARNPGTWWEICYPEVAGELGVEPVEERLVVEALVRHGDLRALRRRPVAQYLDQRFLVRAPSCPPNSVHHHKIISHVTRCSVLD